MRQWFALHTKPRSERRVANTLAQVDIETFLPEVTTRKSGARDKTAPLFPTYLFVRMDLGTGAPSGWQWTPGLRYLVSYGDEPVPIPDEVIRLISHKLHEIESNKSSLPYRLKPGDIVRIQEGPFDGMLAMFEGPSTPSDRVKVLLYTLNRSFHVKLTASNLEKVSKPAELEGAKRPRRTRGRGRRIR